MSAKMWKTRSLHVPSVSRASRAHLDLTGLGGSHWCIGNKAWLARMNTLNLGVISVTCPHLLGLAYNCCDLFLLSRQIWNVLSRLILVFLSLIHIIWPFGSCLNFSLTNKCRRLYVCLHITCISVCVQACRYSIPYVQISDHNNSSTWPCVRLSDVPCPPAVAHHPMDSHWRKISLVTRTSPLS